MFALICLLKTRTSVRKKALLSIDNQKIDDDGDDFQCTKQGIVLGGQKLFKETICSINSASRHEYNDLEVRAHFQYEQIDDGTHTKSLKLLQVLRFVSHVPLRRLTS